MIRLVCRGGGTLSNYSSEQPFSELRKVKTQSQSTGPLGTSDKQPETQKISEAVNPTIPVIGASATLLAIRSDEMNSSLLNRSWRKSCGCLASPAPSNFIRDIILEDLKTNKHKGRVQTRFPPEPNGYLHIGHAKAICIDFGLADEFGGHTNLRFDDTNPEKEETEYVESIKADVNWLGFQWDGLFYASDYFDQLYEWAIKLIKDGKAYVDDLSADEIRKHRGTLTEPGKDSPYRNRSVEENLDLFERMRAGEFPDGSRVLRAKIDMASPNLNLRDPVMYRILHAEHHRTGNKWCIYPMYDYAHGQSDSIERVTHSLCTLEFEDHRPLYNWFIEQLGIFPSRQIEFDRLNLTYTLLSKRKLLQLVQEGRVSGWDDPRMPTLGGIRRRGYTPEAMRNFVARSAYRRPMARSSWPCSSTSSAKI